MSAKLERIYWLYQQLKGNRYPSRTWYCRQYEVAASSFKRDLEFLRHRLLAPIAYDRRHNGYRLTDDSFELPSYWFNPPALLFLAATCNQLRHLEGGSFGGLADKIENLLRLHHSEMPASDETFTAPRFDVDRHIRQSYGIFKGGRQLRQVTLQFDPHMARLVGGMFWHPEQQGESTPDGGLRLTIPVADFTEITMRILSFGRHVEVLAPEELRWRVAEEVGEMGKKTIPAGETNPKKHNQDN